MKGLACEGNMEKELHTCYRARYQPGLYSLFRLSVVHTRLWLDFFSSFVFRAFLSTCWYIVSIAVYEELYGVVYQYIVVVMFAMLLRTGGEMKNSAQVWFLRRTRRHKHL